MPDILNLIFSIVCDELVSMTTSNLLMMRKTGWESYGYNQLAASGFICCLWQLSTSSLNKKEVVWSIENLHTTARSSQSPKIQIEKIFVIRRSLQNVNLWRSACANRRIQTNRRTIWSALFIAFDSSHPSELLPLVLIGRLASSLLIEFESNIMEPDGSTTVDLTSRPVVQVSPEVLQLVGIFLVIVGKYYYLFVKLHYLYYLYTVPVVRNW